MTPNEEYFNVIKQQYNELKRICREVCKRNGEKFSEDIFQDTIIKINNIITKKGQLDDMSEKGIMNYFTRSFVNNLRCEKRNSYIAKRDHNISQETMNERYELTHSPLKNKLIKDLLEDFSILYIMKRIEDNFDNQSCHLYRLKTLCGMTYKQIHDKTHIKKSREIIIDINNWVKCNITRDEIWKVFQDVYGNLII